MQISSKHHVRSKVFWFKIYFVKFNNEFFFVLEIIRLLAVGNGDGERFVVKDGVMTLEYIGCTPEYQ